MARNQIYDLLIDSLKPIHPLTLTNPLPFPLLPLLPCPYPPPKIQLGAWLYCKLPSGSEHSQATVSCLVFQAFKKSNIARTCMSVCGHVEVRYFSRVGRLLQLSSYGKQNTALVA